MSSQLTGQEKMSSLSPVWSEAAARRLKTAVARFGRQEDVASAAGISRSALAAILNGSSAPRASNLEAICKVIGVSVEEIRNGDASRGDLISIREIDLTFGMGGSYMEIPVTETMHDFPREWVRAYTRAEPDLLYFAQGIGDSMASTILDSDLLLIDASQNHLNMGDKIWAISCGEVGMVKRLRANPGGSVTVLSDNPLVPPFDVVDGEMSILGRVVAIVRKM